jgi:hypothetical protein
MKTILTILGLILTIKSIGQPVSPGERIIYFYDNNEQLLSVDNENKSDYGIAVEYDRIPEIRPDAVINDSGQFGGFFDRKPYSMTIYFFRDNDTMTVGIKNMGTYFTLDGIVFQPGKYELSNNNERLPSAMTIKNWDIYRKE